MLALNYKKVGFPFVFEVLVWIIYVCLYKYAYYIDLLKAPFPGQTNFPYPQLILYSVGISLYLIPYYRLLVPGLLTKKRYGLLCMATIVYFTYASKLSNITVDWLFWKMNTIEALSGFYKSQLSSSLQKGKIWLGGWNLNMLFTDLIAFSCIAFVRYAFENEARRHQLEKDNLTLQLNMLKTQLQPHFLFNTLNSIYALSLSGSAETPRLILLLSEMMRYVLYECNKEYIALPEEIAFLNNYFEMEQKKYPAADIQFTTQLSGKDIMVPPLLFQPLIENSFKHGKHRFQDNSIVYATLTAGKNEIYFAIENDVLTHQLQQKKPGGIGLANIRQRLHLYYPGKHTLLTTEQDGRYKALLTLQV